MHHKSEKILVNVNMFKEYFVIVAFIAAAIGASPSPYSESKTSQTLDSINSDTANDKAIDDLKIILKSVFDSIKNQADESTNEASEMIDHVMMKNVKEDEFIYLSGIIQKVKMCAKQIIENGKGKIESLMEEMRTIIGDISKMRECKGTKEEKHECIRHNMDLVNQAISDLIEDTSKQMQWLTNDILPDFYHCVTAEQDLLLLK
nr:unnamed protein product [Callosobruchus chinensis]